MKRRVLWSVILTMALSLVFYGANQSPAQAAKRTCTFQLLDRATNTANENKHVIVCFATKLGVSVEKALAVARTESRYDEWAVNPDSGALGLYQHMPTYWDQRVRRYDQLLDRYRVDHRVWHNPRANTLIALGLARDVGWWPWGG